MNLLLLPTEGAESAVVSEQRSVADLREANLSRNTRLAYAADFEAFVEWCCEPTQQYPTDLPFPPRVIAHYLEHLNGKRALSTVERAMYAIVFKHESNGFPNPKKDSLVGDTWARLVKENTRATETSAKMLAENLALVVRCIDGEDLESLRDRALLLTMFKGALLRGEAQSLLAENIVAHGPNFRLRVARSEDVELRDVVLYAEDGELDPVLPLEAYMMAANITDGPVFRNFDQEGNGEPVPISLRTIGTIVKRRAKRANMRAEQITPRSLRSGWVVQSAMEGETVQTIAKQTGHKLLHRLSPLINEGRELARVRKLVPVN